MRKNFWVRFSFSIFCRKRGWFDPGRDGLSERGSKHFLRELFEKKHGDFKNFFNDVLEPLFYDAPGMNPPYVGIYLRNTLFSNSRETREGDTGDGILDVFDRYNFTVREDEPLEKEVAIDPAFLGKTYERFQCHPVR